MGVMKGRAGQLAFAFPPGRGGRRAGAGRKPAGKRARMPHGRRPEHRASEPVHVTVRVKVRSLRHQFVFPTVRAAIAASNRRGAGRFRVVHFSVQANHLHCIVESASREALNAGVRGLGVSLARRVNRLLFRRGPLIADRWHARALATPRAVRHALVYVMANFKKHEAHRPGAIDPYSSAIYFEGFAEFGAKRAIDIDPLLEPRPRSSSPPCAPAETWLLRVGWRKRGAISIHEAPKD